MADHAGHVSAPTTPLIGRERELGALRAALEAALAGHGGLTLIGGEAGIGKTALAEALLTDAAERGAAVLVGRCYDLSEMPPYGPWIELFERAPQGLALPPRPNLLGGADETTAIVSQAALFRETHGYLDALTSERPMVVLLEDLHWADGATLDLLRVVARDLATMPLLILVTYRADELPREHPLYALLPALVRECRAARLDLRPLAPGAVRALGAARYPLPPTDEARLGTYLYARAGGNPLFIGELLRTLEQEGALRHDDVGWRLGDPAAAPVPTLLRQIIEGRVARLGGGARELLLVAAVIGQEVPLDLWATVSGAVEEATLLPLAEQAIAVRLLAETPGGAGVRFAHALIREALYEGAGARRRRDIHRRAGEVLAASVHPDPDAVAYHLGRAGDRRILPWLIRAAFRARAAAVWLGAAERFDNAAALLVGDEGRRRERAWLLFYCGRLNYFSDTTRALQYFDESEGLGRLADDRVLLAYLRATRGLVRCYRGQIRQGLAEVERGVAELESLPGEYAMRSSEDAALTVIAGLLPDDERQAHLRSGLQRTATALHANLANWYGWTGRYREALTVGETAVARIAAALGADHARQAAAARLGLGHSHAALGRPEEARRAYALARAGHAAAGDSNMVACNLWIELLLVAIPLGLTQLNVDLCRNHA